MIIEKDNSREQLGRMVGEKVEMRFSDAARGILMDNFAKNLYSRPKEAVLREYSTNAIDAQIEIGETRPIEITLPNSLNPVLQIRDFGVGLDQQGIIDVYSQYGASTKRDSNDYNGTLGLGGKSAFAYSNQFNVVSIKNGVRIEVQVTRNEDGTGDMVTVDERPTAEPRGTLIKIPTKRYDTFVDEAEALYRWFTPGSVSVNGQIAKAFDPNSDNVLKVAEGIYVVKNPKGRYSYTENQDDLVVMGNIAYPTKLESGLNRYTHHIVAFVPLGAVQFNPSRESLLNNSITTRALGSIGGDFKRGIISTLQAHIDAAPSRPEAASIVANWRDIVPAKVVPADGYKYKGETIPEALNLGQLDPPARILSVHKNGYHNSHSKARSVGLEHFHGSMWVEGYTAEKVSTAQAQKARKHIQDNQLSIDRAIVMVHEIPDTLRSWIGTIVKYDTIKAVKLPQAARTVGAHSGRIAGSYDVYTTDPAVILKRHGSSSLATGISRSYTIQDGVPAEEFKHWSPPLFYAIGSRFDCEYIRAGLEAVQGSKGYTLVCIASTREAKLKRSFPNIKLGTDAVKAGWDAWKTGIGADVPLAMAIQADWGAREFRYLDPSKIDDPELAKYCKLSAMDLTKTREAASVFSRVLGQNITRPAIVDWFGQDRYPLLSVERGMSDNTQAHLYLYLNTIYAARLSGAKF